MSFYLYCVGDQDVTAVYEATAGVEGAPTCLLPHDDLAVVVSEYGGDRVAVTPENVRAHNRIISRLLHHATPLPFRFGTIADGPRLGAYLTRSSEPLREALVRVRGCVEMSVKIMWDVEAAGRWEKGEAAAPPTAPAGRGSEAGGGTVGRGTAFLIAKQRAVAGERRASELAAWLAAIVGDTARETRVETRGAAAAAATTTTAAPTPTDTTVAGAAAVLRVAHLVERGRLNEYRARVRAAQSQRAGDDRIALRFLTSGAWPPYSFSYLRM